MRKNDRARTGLQVAIICLFSLSVLICSSSTPVASAAETKAAVKEWEIPVLTVLSGQLVYAGVSAGWGADYAARMINQAGGIAGVPVKITKYDYAYENAKAVAIMAQLVQNNLVVLGPMDSSAAMAVASIIKESGVPTISGAMTPDARKSQRPWGMSWLQDGADANVAVNKWLSLNKDIKSVVIIYPPANPGSVYQAVAAEAEMTRMGIKIAGKIETVTGQIDMRPQAARALSLKADGYYTALTADDHVKMLKALNAGGMKDGRRILAAFSANSPALFDLGKGYLEGTYLWDTMSLDNSSPEWRALLKAYQEEHNGANPIAPTIGFYDAVYAVKTAIESLGITGDPVKRTAERQKIKDFLYNNQHLPGAMGPYRYVNGNKVASFFLLQVKDNKFLTAAVVPGPATPAP